MKYLITLSDNTTKKIDVLPAVKGQPLSLDEITAAILAAKAEARKNKRFVKSIKTIKK